MADDLNIQKSARALRDTLHGWGFLRGTPIIAWTPTYLGATTPGTTTYSIQVGAYTQLDKLVIASATIVWTAATGTGIALFSLPIAPSSTTNLFQSGGARIETITFANSTPGVNITPSVANFRLLSPLTNAAGTNVAVEAAGNIAYTIAYLID